MPLPHALFATSLFAALWHHPPPCPRPARARAEGHRRKFLVVIDDTPECTRALLFAGRRAEHTGGALVLLYVIVPGDFTAVGRRREHHARRGDGAGRGRARPGSPTSSATRPSIEPQVVIREGAARRGDRQADRGRRGHRHPRARRRAPTRKARARWSPRSPARPREPSRCRSPSSPATLDDETIAAIA